jgi:alanine-glyoxylate transaminase/(R)-3-amino-2-methylpropionate-pyruvate transaminase
VGTHFLNRLAKLRDKYPTVVGDVRGKGLMVGMELVSNAETRTPLHAPHFLEIWEECKDHGVLLGRGGLRGNVSNKTN